MTDLFQAPPSRQTRRWPPAGILRELLHTLHDYHFPELAL